MKSMDNDFSKTIAEGARKHQAEHPAEYELIVNGIPSEHDVQRQADLVGEMIAQKVSAIVIAPADPKTLVSPCKQAQEAGIVVVNIDQQARRAGSRRTGHQGAVRWSGQPRRGEDGGRTTWHPSSSRETRWPCSRGSRPRTTASSASFGFEDAMKEAGLKIVDSQSARWEIDTAQKIATDMISKHTDIKALLCCSDSMALGALAAAQGRGPRGGCADRRLRRDRGRE